MRSSVDEFVVIATNHFKLIEINLIGILNHVFTFLIVSK